MTRLEALEAVADAARGVCDVTGSGTVDRWATLERALAALDQTAPQPPSADPQPHRGSVADAAGLFEGGPHSVEWLREQRGVPMIPDLLAQAYGEEQR